MDGVCGGVVGGRKGVEGWFLGVCFKMLFFVFKHNFYKIIFLIY